MKNIIKSKDRLLNAVKKGDSKVLIHRVGIILNEIPKTRLKSEVQLLTVELYKRFYADCVKNGMITLEDLLDLPCQADINRARAKIQNKFGLFLGD